MEGREIASDRCRPIWCAQNQDATGEEHSVFEEVRMHSIQVPVPVRCLWFVMTQGRHIARRSVYVHGEHGTSPPMRLERENERAPQGRRCTPTRCSQHFRRTSDCFASGTGKKKRRKRESVEDASVCIRSSTLQTPSSLALSPSLSLPLSSLLSWSVIWYASVTSVG